MFLKFSDISLLSFVRKYNTDRRTSMCNSLTWKKPGPPEKWKKSLFYFLKCVINYKPVLVESRGVGSSGAGLSAGVSRARWMLGIRLGFSRAVQAHGCEATCPDWVLVHRSVSVSVVGSKGCFLSEGTPYFHIAQINSFFYFVERSSDKVQKKKVNLGWFTRHSTLLLAI